MIDKSKTYRTRDGREVRIYATDGGPNGDLVHGCYKSSKSGWTVTAWKADGYYAFDYSLHDLDLIEVKPRIQRKVWVNVYPQSETIWISEEAANECCTDKRIACVKLTIDCEEGEGL